MSKGRKMDVLCDKCIHKDVCKFRKDFERISYVVNNITITFPKSGSNVTDDGFTLKKLSSFDWIEPINLHCKRHHL